MKPVLLLSIKVRVRVCVCVCLCVCCMCLCVCVCVFFLQVRNQVGERVSMMMKMPSRSRNFAFLALSVAFAVSQNQPSHIVMILVPVNRSTPGSRSESVHWSAVGRTAKGTMSLDPSLRREAITWPHVTHSGRILNLSRPGSLEDEEAPAPPIVLSATWTRRRNSYDLQWRPGHGGGSSPIHGYLIRYRMVSDSSSEEVLGTDGLSWQTSLLPSDQRQFRLAPLRSAALYEVEMEAQGVTTHSLPAMFTFRTGRDRGTTGRSHDRSRDREPEKGKEREGFEERLAPQHPQPAEPATHTVPEAPDRPTVTMATATSVYLTWNPRANGGAPITHFHVQAIRLGRAGAVARHSDWYGDWHTVVDNVSPSKLSVEVTRLQPGVTYTFRVSAWNMYGESKRSKVSHPYTVQRSRRGPERPGPYIAYTEALSHEQILLNWMYTPNVNSTPIRGFYIFYRPTDSGSAEDYAIDVVASDVRWHQISELQAGTSYDIKMRMFSDGGESEDSNVMICETLGEFDSFVFAF
uniref:Fibronectin type-III domain-containing protein n=1 Tax=Eptatretus burgeri TaxID=7764 RepID=A0A8C4PXW6_EPTBU